ncbi:putative SOUL heme-binding protein [Rosa chinensis]|uniref:Putative SOUL heme-binding protein n=1 Tax=Rosa chinensis TaxID=74649 RepID=A0A2P6PR36_ROSCH|nr:putative SOUL heme-binding protein [Rosa chinensis]
MTAPVLTSIVPGAGPLHSSACFVRFYLPMNHYIAVRKFSGFARDSNIVQEAHKLATRLSRSPWANSTSEESRSAYSIAQYNSPFRLIGCVNEVWVDVNASGLLFNFFY